MKVRRFWRMMFFGKHRHAITHHTFVFINLLLLLFPCVVVAQPSNPSSSPSSADESPTNNRYKFSPAMSVMFVLIVIVFFFFSCFSVYAGRCIESRSPGSGLFIIHEETQQPRRARPQGLEPNVIDTFPTFLYSDVKKVRLGKDIGALECSICLNEFKDEETLRLLPKCCHVFHPECIDMWLTSHVTCPVCRADLVPVPGEMGTYDCEFPSRDSDDDTTHPTWVDEEFGEGHSETEIELDSSSREIIKSVQLSNSQRQLVQGKFPRSHSTGHSLIRPWNDFERFTLRLPQDVQKNLMKPKHVRARSNLVFPTAVSPKTGYRSSSAGHGLPIHNIYEQFNHESHRDRWSFTFFTRSRSVQAPSGGHNLNSNTTSGNSSKPNSFDWLFRGPSSKDEAGERSFARLIGKN